MHNNVRMWTQSCANGHVAFDELELMMRNGRMKHVMTGLVLASALVASGCATSSRSGMGSPLAFASTTSSRDIYTASLNGGLVSLAKGISVSGSDKQLALQAEYKALEAAPGGQAVTWQGSDVRGEVIAAPPYQVGSQNCRQYTHSITEGGTSVVERGAACRNPNGTWTPLT
jgi:surface antigen